MSVLEKIFGTPEERRLRRQKHEEESAKARAKLLEFLVRIARIPAPVLAALIALLGIFIGNMLGRSEADAKWHKDKLTQIYSDCLYYSFRVQAELAPNEPPEWNSIKDDVGQTIRAGNLLFAYLSGEKWDQMNDALSGLQVYSLSYASGHPSTDARDKLRKSAKEVYDVAHASYQYDSRIFGWWKS